MSTPERDRDLVTAMRTAARELARSRSIRDLEQTLHQIVVSAVATVPGVEAGSVSMTRDGRVETRQPTSDTVRKLDEAQGELYEGPCIQALDDRAGDGLVIATDFASDDAQRWPRFAPLAAEAGFRSLMSTQLTAEPATGDGPRAALNLYSAEPDAFDERATVLAGIFGAQAAMLLYGAEHVGHLQRAVDNRDLIGRAKGILMERFNVDDAAAFQLLVKSSQDTNMKVTAVAQWLSDQAGEPTTADPS
jgi:hypothetical protein